MQIKFNSILFVTLEYYNIVIKQQIWYIPYIHINAKNQNSSIYKHLCHHGDCETDPVSSHFVQPRHSHGKAMDY